MRAIFLFICFLLSCLAAYYGQPLVDDNSDIITIIITVMTVFAGFLVAIITILGDPAMIPEGSWRKAEVRHHRLEGIIIRQTALFYLYLIAIAFLFAGVLISKEPDKVVSKEVKSWIEYGYLFWRLFIFANPSFASSAGRNSNWQK